MAKTKSKEEQEKQAKKEGGQDTKPAMPLFYKKPEPLDAKKHKDLALIKNFSLEFAKPVNAVPINLIEMPQAAHFYPITFTPDDSATPVVILGMRDKENLFMTDENLWLKNTYVPAYIRRYPFIFSEMPDSEQLTLCFDNTTDVIEENGEQRFFTEDGKPAKLAEDALNFCKSYHAAAQQTIPFSQALIEHGLLIDREAQVSVADGRKINYSGFRIIDQKKFNELDDKVIIEFRKKGWLPFIYAHFFSEFQWNKLTSLLNEKLQKEAK
ncbi:MAG: SapC family protein [Alphaproteobacteria bacterium]|nr:SapC family protein [Alphaproteobacteria bacterium]